MRNKQQTKSSIYAKTSTPSYHTRPTVRLEKPIFFDFPIDNVKYSSGPRMKYQGKFHAMKSVPQKQKELVYDPFNPPKSSKLPNLNSYKSEPNLCNLAQNSSLGESKQKEIVEPQSLPSNACRSRRLSKIQQNSRLSSQVKIHNIQSHGIGCDGSLSITKVTSNISNDNHNNDIDQIVVKPSNSNNDISIGNNVFSQSSNRLMIFSGDFECGNLGYVYRTGLCEYEINMLPDSSRTYSAHWYFFKVENIPAGIYTFTIAGIFRNLNLHDVGVLPVALSMSSVKNYKNNSNSRSVIDPKLASSRLDIPGWQRFGTDMNFCCTKKSPSPRFSFTFSFSVNTPEPDTIYFAYLYPYTYSQLRKYLSTKLPAPIVPSILCKTQGGVDFPAIFWDADLQQCVDVASILNCGNPQGGTKYVLNYKTGKSRPFTTSKSTAHSSSSSSSSRSTKPPTATSSSVPKQTIKSHAPNHPIRTVLNASSGGRKPLIVFTARHHPGETCASYAMEEFMTSLFSHLNDDDDEDTNDKSQNELKIASRRLLHSFSFLILPMMNIDGVVCGFFRHCIGGYDMNRSWIRPSPNLYPTEATVVRLIDRLVQNRPFLFFLDFHGHSSQCNAFTYGVWNDDVPLNEYEAIFPQLMSRITDLFDDDNSISLARESYSQTMRVALHHRYKIPFAYTLEMSYGGMDSGSRRGTQFSQGGYREIGQASVKALAEMLLDHVPIDRVTRNYVPPVKPPQ